MPDQSGIIEFLPENLVDTIYHEIEGLALSWNVSYLKLGGLLASKDMNEDGRFVQQ